MDGAGGLGECAAEGPWSLPEGWCWVPLGKLGTWTGGGTPSKANAAFWTEGTVPWVSPKDMKVDIIGDTEDKITTQAVEQSSTKYVAERSVLMVMRSGILRHSFPVSVTDRVVTLNQDLRALTPREGIDPTYVARYLALAAQRILHDCSKDGTTVNSIEASALERFRVPIAPLPEQRRIVARIDALFAEIAEGEAALAEARKGLETFRRALLKAAVTGELTKDWREANPLSEAASDLLDHIKRESEVRYVSKRRVRTKARPVGDELPRLPDSWAWVRLSELGEFGRGKSRHRPRDDVRLYGGAMPFVQTGVVSNSDDYIRTYTQTYSSFGIQQSRVWPSGTLCITIAANIAKTAITTFDCCFPDSIVGLFPAKGISAYWVHIWMSTIQQRLERFAPATAQKNINLDVLESVTVPVPPAKEANEILRRVSDALTAAADTVAMLDAQAAEAARLKQSILKAAFEGRLVAQDLADEPASVLFARLASNSSVERATRKRARRSVA